MTSDYFCCPVCGEELPNNANFCPNCGSDDNTGWSEETYLDGADWIHEEMDFFEVPGTGESTKFHWSVWIVVALVLIGFVLSIQMNS